MRDVIVIGGGPGGSVCARELAAMGHNTLVLESCAPGEYKPCAGGIPPRNNTVTPMKEDIIERKIDSGFFCTADETTFTITAPDDMAAIAFKADYEAHLHELAIKAGAEIAYETAVQKVHFEEDRVRVSARRGGRAVNYTAKCVVGAFGMGATRLRQDFGIDCQSFFEVVMMELKLPRAKVDENFGLAAESYLDSEITTAGRAWIYPKRSGVAAGITSAAGEGFDALEEKLERFIREHPVASVKLDGHRAAFGKKEDSTFRRLIPRDIVKRSYGDRFLLVGDAAGAADPLTGEGIYHAQRTGHIASRVLHKCLRAHSLDADSLAEYQHRWHRAIVLYDTCYNRKSARFLFDCPQQDEVVQAILHVSEGNEKVREAVLWLFAGLRSQREVMLHAASPRLLYSIIQKLTLRKAAPLIPRFLKTYSISDLF